MLIEASLIKEFGPIIAKKAWDFLNQPNNQEKLENANTLLNQGKSLLDALKEVFGEEKFLKILDDIVYDKKSTFTYEAGRNNYIKLNTDDILNTDEKITLLRNELNINLDRILNSHGESQEVLSFFKGAMSEWIHRHKKILGGNNNVKNAFEKINELLDGSERNAKEAFDILRLVFGVSGALSIIYAVLLATGIGMGILSKLSIFIFGIPGGQVLGVSLMGAILFKLATIKLTDKDIMNSCIKVAYKLLDGHSS